MTEDVLQTLLETGLGSLTRTGKWSLASCAIAEGRTAFWLSDALRTSTFEIGSVTKTMTALTLADMVTKGEVGLTSPVAAFLPEAAGSDVTLGDLASHTSGYPRLPSGFLLAGVRKLGDPYAAYSDKAVQRAVTRVSRQAGTERPYAYSNLGYGVLGRALSAAAGEPFGALVRSRVLRPLGLTAVTFDVEAGAERLEGHDPRGQRVPDWHNRALAGCASVWSSIQDLYKYLFAHLERSASPLADAVDLVGRPRAAAGPDEQIGLAWHLTETPQGRVHWHSGGTGGFSSFIGFNPSTQAGMALLMNRRHAPGHAAVSLRLLARLSGAA